MCGHKQDIVQALVNLFCQFSCIADGTGLMDVAPSCQWFCAGLGASTYMDYHADIGKSVLNTCWEVHEVTVHKESAESSYTFFFRPCKRTHFYTSSGFWVVHIFVYQRGLQVYYYNVHNCFLRYLNCNCIHSISSLILWYGSDVGIWLSDSWNCLSNHLGPVLRGCPTMTDKAVRVESILRQLVVRPKSFRGLPEADAIQKVRVAPGLFELALLKNGDRRRIIKVFSKGWQTVKHWETWKSLVFNKNIIYKWVKHIHVLLTGSHSSHKLISASRTLSFSSPQKR